ncbi:hypothetical protein SeMB42_g01749 [Synchytrium endobioticum]|uniref:Polysaccharide lyase 14 domain-containing protein n=1 Tax=Synchytrium endobioticum TaxID=286115 RepID=A0A507CZC2_9FUNG|nr:hypothetical protein SeLEV6574_g04440 [Synchytrium endobioticum]TPX51974.1 hypothetical protein SeMB42_g01749 [Synchytrium endobioticum]
MRGYTTFILVLGCISLTSALSTLLMAPQCTDGLKNGQETSIDCGGPTCLACQVGHSCRNHQDCLSSHCSGKKCVAATCSDAIKNGKETDVDCGGGGACRRCDTGMKCTVDKDCASGRCTRNVCSNMTKTHSTEQRRAPVTSSGASAIDSTSTVGPPTSLRPLSSPATLSLPQTSVKASAYAATPTGDPGSVLASATPSSTPKPTTLPTFGAPCVSSCKGTGVRCIDDVCQKSWQAPKWNKTGNVKSMFDGWKVQLDAGSAGNLIVQNPDASNATDLVLKVKFPVGSRNPAADPRGGIGLYAAPLQLRNATHITLQYDVYFPSSWNFVLGGKLPGLYGGDTGCSGGASAAACFSSRHMWRVKGAGECYLYLPLDAQPSSFCKVPPQTICDSDYGISLGRGSFVLKPGHWNTIRQKIALNTFDSYDEPNTDGSIQILFGLDGKPVKTVIDYQSMVWRLYKNVTALGIQFDSFFGGSDKSYVTPKTQYLYFRNVSLSAY